MMKPSSGTHTVNHVIELDGLRGLLALWVVLGHMLLWCRFAEPPFPARLARAVTAFLYSSSAVETFYILSGFAITFLLSSRRPSWGGFMLGRFFRIYPVYFVCLMLGLATMSLTPFVLRTASWRATEYFSGVGALSASELAAPWQHLGAHLSLLHGVVPKAWLPGSAGTLDVPAWSISVEWQFYLLAIPIVWCARSATGLIALAGAVWFALRHAQPWMNPLPAFLPLDLPAFLIGIGSYHLYARFAASGHAPAESHGLLVGAVIALAILLPAYTGSLTIWAVAFGSLFLPPVGWLGKSLSAVRRLLAHPATQWLGRISYPLYLVHWPLIIVALTILLRSRPGVHYGEALAWLLAAGLPVVLGAAWLLHRAVEAPFMRLGKRFTLRSSRPAGVAARPALPAVFAPVSPAPGILPD